MEYAMFKKEWFKKEWLKISEYPSNVIPADAKEFTATEGDCTVQGFYAKNGDVHIQIIRCPAWMKDQARMNERLGVE